MSRHLSSDSELKKMMEKVTEKEIQDLLGLVNKPFDEKDVNQLSKIAAMFGQSERCLNEKTVSAA
jgi:hypothetical protein